MFSSQAIIDAPFLSLSIVGVLFLIERIIWRLYLCPTARFPGPLWAKLSFSCEFYYEWIQPGKFYERIHQMHEKYGPIVRVTPEELHIEDPLFYNEFYVDSHVRRTNAYLRYAQGTGFDDVFALVGTHEGHKIIRDPVHRLYSRISVHESGVNDCAQHFRARLDQARGASQPINLSNACLSLALDVSTMATFESPSRYLDDPNFNEKLFQIQKSGLVHVPLFGFLPAAARFVTTPLLQFVSSCIPELREWEQATRRQTFKGELNTMSSKLQGRSNTIWHRKEFAGRVGQLVQQNSIFHVAHAIESAITHLTLNHNQRQLLQQELAKFWESRPTKTATYMELKALPYLTACIQEGLRLGAASLKRSPRIFPDDDIEYNHWVIPRGTPVSMTTYFMHMDPTVFPEPKAFRPERWLDIAPESLEYAYCVPFGKGSRSCGGETIARMQMYHALSQLYSPGSPELELHQSDTSDVELAHGYVFPQPRLDSPGVRVLVRAS